MVFTSQVVASPSASGICSSPMVVAATSPCFARIGSPRYHDAVTSTTTTMIADYTFRGLCSSTHSGTDIPFRLGPTLGRLSPFRCFIALSPELKTTLDKVVTSQKILNSLNVPFETINILENEVLRQGLKEYSSWPTFPQLYIDGEFLAVVTLP